MTLTIQDGAIHATSPFDGQALTPIACTDVTQIPPLVARARAASETHAARSIDERVRLLVRFKDALLARADAMVETLHRECGKPEAESWLHEVVPTADLCTFWSRQGPDLLAAHEPSLDPVSYPGKRAVIERAPRGVIGLITPWNFPIAIPLRTLFPALLAGNGIVFKPSEHTAASGALITEAAAEVYGADLVVLAQGGGEVGAALIAHVDAVVFTGSVATGKKVAVAAAERLIPSALELGGKDAALVLEDANIERTARGLLWGGMANAGQNCAGVERVFVVKSVDEKLRARMTTLASELSPGRDFGPLTTAAQLATVERHVEAAVQAGGEVLVGGARIERDGRWFQPTLLKDVPRDCEALTEETFGPVIPILEVDDEAAGVLAVNDSRFGLTASVWTKDLRRGERVARQLRAGTVTINNHGFTGAIPALPWTGVGDSGYGVTNSAHTLDVLTRPRTIVVDARKAKAELWWHPYTPGLIKAGRSLATLRSGRGPITKAKAIGSLVRGFATRNKK